ncbi:MAG: hypothetical protein QG656_2618, partial [Candidatus Hydrogenedentes bacterium]|nr:hypothetical protein [Candidatus Hydrogenedentota bacterium]
MSPEMNRREAIVLGAASLASLSFLGGADDNAIPPIVKTHDEMLEQMLSAQIVDAQNRWCGSIPDDSDLHHCTAAARLLRDASAAYFHPQSKFHADKGLFDRMKLAADFLRRSQNGEGNIDLLTTNFNSPPDTAFTVHDAAAAAALAQMHGDKDVLSLLEEFLRRAGQGLTGGGVHTPNHRWAVCAALAQINALFPDTRYVDRIDQWLAEGIDIDEEGQYTERSTTGYNAVVDKALVIAAHKLNRPELLDPVRKNLDAMVYLLHPNGEVVTEISSRQDLNTRGTMGGYWFPLRYMAIRDGNGVYASMLAPLEPGHCSLATLMEYPDLQKDLPAPAPIPEDYEKDYSLAGITRIRRGKTSATILHKGNSRWITLRRGDAIINAVRFACPFFGKGQFVPASFEKRDGGFYFTQRLGGRYLQPITDPALLPVRNDAWSGLTTKRKMTQICT